MKKFNVKENEDGSKTYETVYTAPGVFIRRKETVWEDDEEDEVEDDIFDRIIIKKKDKSNRKEVEADLERIKDWCEKKRKCENCKKKCNLSEDMDKYTIESEKSEFSGIFDEYSTEQLSELRDNLPKLIYNKDVLGKIIALLIEENEKIKKE